MHILLRVIGNHFSVSYQILVILNNLNNGWVTINYTKA